MPTGQTIHKTLEIDGDRLLCASCGWVHAARRKGRPYCSRAKRAHSGKSNKWRRHRARLGSVCEVCGATDDLQVDHDHSCCPGARSCAKCYRGTLCRPCNMAEHHVADAVRRGILAELIEYTRTRSLTTIAGTGGSVI